MTDPTHPAHRSVNGSVNGHASALRGRLAVVRDLPPLLDPDDQWWHELDGGQTDDPGWCPPDGPDPSCPAGHDGTAGTGVAGTGPGRLIGAPGRPDVDRTGTRRGSTDDGSAPARRVRFTPASHIRIRPTYWLWDDRIPQGALVLGPGREGIGKSLFCAWLTAQVTHGHLPGVHHGQPRAVVYAATEDSWERTIAGRLIVAGADMDRVYRVDVESITGTTLPLSLPRDCDDMATEIDAAGVGLLVIDPLISAVDSRIDPNGEGLREALEPLSALADRTGCSIFGLAHFNKATGTDALSRITGSRAFAAVARAVIGFARDTGTDDGSCVLSQLKNNLGPTDLPSLRYTVESVTVDTEEGPGQWGVLRFLGETDTHVDDLLNDTPEQRTKRKEAAREQIREWLLDYLTDQGGSALATDVEAAGAAAARYSKDQLKRAKKDLGIESSRAGTVWTWVLPESVKGAREQERKGAEAP
jgi:hypothetical protein